MIEMRWLIPERPSQWEHRKLQYRVMTPCVDASGALCPGEWGEWKTAPVVVSTKDFDNDQ